MNDHEDEEEFDAPQMNRIYIVTNIGAMPPGWSLKSEIEARENDHG